MGMLRPPWVGCGVLDALIEEREDELGVGPRRVLRCRACGLEVADADDAGGVDDGPARRTFFNPAGLVFDVLLLRAARNLVLLGPPSTEFTWFPGRPWQVALCGGCGRQLGWRWSGGVAFFGLLWPELAAD